MFSYICCFIFVCFHAPQLAHLFDARSAHIYTAFFFFFFRFFVSPSFCHYLPDARLITP